MAESATFNKPPQTQEAYWVVKAILLSSGLTTANPEHGVHMSPTRPHSYRHETRGPGIIAGNAISIVAMLAITVTRLYLRWYIPRLKWGADDAFMVPVIPLVVAYPALQISW